MKYNVIYTTARGIDRATIKAEADQTAEIETYKDMRRRAATMGKIERANGEPVAELTPADLVTVAEAADIAGVTATTIYRYLKRGALVPCGASGGRYLFRVRDVWTLEISTRGRGCAKYDPKHDREDERPEYGEKTSDCGHVWRVTFYDCVNRNVGQIEITGEIGEIGGQVRDYVANHGGTFPRAPRKYTVETSAGVEITTAFL